MAGELQKIGTTAFNIMYNSLTWIVIGMLIAAVFGAYWYFKKWNRKRKSYTLTALIIKPDGDWYTDMLGYFPHGDNVDKLHMKKMDWTLPLIPSEFIRNNKCILYNYGVKQFAIVPPSVWSKLDLSKPKIELINMQMKNFVFLEQRAAVSRWAYLKDLMTKMAPWIALVLIVAAGITIVWFVTKFSLNMWNNVTGARLAECKALLPQLQLPTPAG